MDELRKYIKHLDNKELAYVSGACCGELTGRGLCTWESWQEFSREVDINVPVEL